MPGIGSLDIGEQPKRFDLDKISTVFDLSCFSHKVCCHIVEPTQPLVRRVELCLKGSHFIHSDIYYITFIINSQ